VTTATHYGPESIDQRFTGNSLDPDVWVASYLPAWSSYAEAAATYELTSNGLRLSIPPEHAGHRLTLTQPAVSGGSRSTITGAWSDGILPLRASRSTYASTIRRPWPAST
jgi:hypothetical protein